MLRLLMGVVGALACGCYAPTAPQGAPCSAEMTCPGSQICDRDGLCRDEPLPDAPQPDIDGDDVFDDVDNCPTVANSGQHDEDGDRVGNECDNCPHVANEDQASTTDADDAGDACDLGINVRETFVLFDGFDDRSADWELDMGWKVMGGALSRDASSTQSFALLELPITPDTIVTTGGQLTPGAGATGPANMGIVMRYSSTSQFYRCSVTPFRSELVRHDGSNFTTLAVADHVMPELDKVRIAMLVVSGNLACVVTMGDPVQLDYIDATPLPGMQVGLRAREANARFDYFFAYRVESVTP